MKKYFLNSILIILILLLSINSTFSSCEIKDSTADVLYNYLENNRKVVNNISKQLTRKEIKPWYHLKRESVKTYNLIFNWWDTLTTWEYFISQIKAEIPYPIQRDLILLKREWEDLNRFLKSALENWYSDNNIKNPCEWVTNCNLSWKASEIISELISNNAKVINLYQLNILWKFSFSDDSNFILVDKNFESDFNKYYNQYTIADCSNTEWWFMFRINKAIKEITLKDQFWQNGIKEWQNAWNLLTWSKSTEEEYIETERRLLREELSRNWISWSNWDAILKNLDEFNNNWYNNWNNPISNSFDTFSDSLERWKTSDIISDFWNTLVQLYDWVTDNSSVSLREFSNKKSDIESENKIISEIDLLYERQKPFISSHNLNSEKLRSKIMDMHIWISQAINTLDKSIPKAIKVCESQDRNSWKCSF